MTHPERITLVMTIFVALLTGFIYFVFRAVHSRRKAAALAVGTMLAALAFTGAVVLASFWATGQWY